MFKKLVTYICMIVVDGTTKTPQVIYIGRHQKTEVVLAPCNHAPDKDGQKTNTHKQKVPKETNKSKLGNV